MHIRKSLLVMKSQFPRGIEYPFIPVIFSCSQLRGYCCGWFFVETNIWDQYCLIFWRKFVWQNYCPKFDETKYNVFQVEKYFFCIRKCENNCEDGTMNSYTYALSQTCHVIKDWNINTHTFNVTSWKLVLWIGFTGSRYSSFTFVMFHLITLNENITICSVLKFELYSTNLRGKIVYSSSNGVQRWVFLVLPFCEQTAGPESFLQTSLNCLSCFTYWRDDPPPPPISTHFHLLSTPPTPPHRLLCTFSYPIHLCTHHSPFHLLYPFIPPIRPITEVSTST